MSCRGAPWLLLFLAWRACAQDQLGSKPKSMKDLQGSMTSLESGILDVVDTGKMWSRSSAQGAKSVGWRMENSFKPHDHVLVGVQESNASVLLPRDFFGAPALAAAESGGIACVVTYYDKTLTAGLEDTEDASAVPIKEVGAAVSVTFMSLASRKEIAIRNLGEPIHVSIPVEKSSEARCAYWDEASETWASDGVEQISNTDGVLVCATTHLTFFGAVFQGIVATIACSQITLLSSEGLDEMFKDDHWRCTPVAVTYWVLLGVLTTIFVWAGIWDSMRAAWGVWGDEFLLIPLEDPPEDIVTASETISRIPSNLRARLAKNCGMAACLLPYTWCKQSSAVRDAFDDVASHWFEYFSEVRDFVEGVCEGMRDSDREAEAGGGYCRFTHKVHMAMAALVAVSARRQAGARLGLSDDVVKFVTEDKDLGELLSASAEPSKKIVGFEDRLNAWRELHRKVVREIDNNWYLASMWGGAPAIAKGIFFMANPILSAFLQSHFWSCSMRVLLFACEVLGSVMVAATFFEVSGEAKGKRSRGCAAATDGSAVDETAGHIGRLIVLGIGSLLLAGLPVTILASLHHRSFKKMPYENSPEWKRQLRVWRLQDRALWVLGLLYLTFCIFFVCLFLANVDPSTDHKSWGISALVSVLQDTLVVPMVLSILVPLLAILLLNLVSRLRGKSQKDLLSAERQHLEKRGNWGPPEVAI